MSADNQSLPPLPEPGDARAAHARKQALEDAQEACKQADLKADAKGERWTLTCAHHIIGALK